MKARERVRFERLQLLVKQWGGKLIYTEDNDVFDALCVDGAPFDHNLGVDYDRKVIVAEKGFNLGGVIHEIAHVFAVNAETSRAALDSDEFDFFGWEFMLARKVDLVPEWVESNYNYSLPNDPFEYNGKDFGGEDFGQLELEEQSDLIEERVDYARQIGIVMDDEPISVRT